MHAARDCALAPVATGGEPLSRPSFPGARFPEEREDAGAHSPGPYVPRCTSTAGRGIHECVHYAVARTEKETSALSSAITHGGHVAASSVRRDAPRCDVPSSPSPPTPLLMHSPALIREDGSHRGHSVPIARVKT